MTILVTGGAGYIGSHMVLALVDGGRDVVVIDDLSSGTRGLVAEKAKFVEGNVSNRQLVRDVIREHGVHSIVHFAGSIVVPDSVADPLTYYQNNVVSSHALITTAVDEGVRNFVFSSTATVYASTSSDPLSEDLPVGPLSPYGRSKLMTEWMLEDTARARDFRYVVLRYFNVAGADAKGRSGQTSPRATHLIKRASQVALGRLPSLDIFGTDYRTKDGTGVRDYIHVSDLVAAHVLALDYLKHGGAPTIMNCGYGRGASVREVVSAVERVLGHPLPTTESPRRPGDPPWLVADARKIKSVLGWQPVHDDLDEIVRTALAWESRLNASG